MMNPAIQNLVLTLGLMQVARKLPLGEPEYVDYLRALYIFSQVVQLGVFYFVMTKIKSKNDTAILKYVEPKGPTGDQGKPVTTTVRDYDLGEVSKSMRSCFMGIAMMSFMHLYLKYTQPLFIQSIMPLVQLISNNEVKLHLRGAPATGELKRPFKVASLLGGAPETDKAAIDAAETTAAAGSKKDL